MDVTLGVLLSVTAVVTVAYWLDFFLRGSVQVVEEEWYLRFERAFPVADGWMAACCLVTAVGLFTTSSYAVAFGLGMHTMIGLCFGPVVWFALLMMTLLVGGWLPDRWLAPLDRLDARQQPQS